MENRDIDLFFSDNGLEQHTVRTAGPHNLHWAFRFGLFPAFIQTQESANRMRIVAQIAAVDEIEHRHLVEMLEANYHTALDARYALADNVVAAAFIHPLRELTAEQFILGLYQVLTCAATFGNGYSGGTMVFGRTSGAGTAGSAENEVGSILDAVVQGIR